MEEELKRELLKVYEVAELKVKFIDFRFYNIFIKLAPEKIINFNFYYNTRYSLNNNIINIIAKIDSYICDLYKKEEYKKE